MAKDCGRIVGKRGAVLQKKFDDDKRRDRPWETSLWACFEPVDLCTFFHSVRRKKEGLMDTVGLLTTFCPCITCGKTYHRFHNDGDMRDWEVVNIPVSPILPVPHFNSNSLTISSAPLWAPQYSTPSVASSHPSWPGKRAGYAPSETSKATDASIG
jgi:hypothetical protein